MKLNNSWLIILLLAAAFLVRLFPIDFPVFTSDEARIAFRGYTLAISGKDELNRPFPLLFDSLDDYQLPAVSYLTAFGAFLFGKSDFGVRIPFILISTIIVLLIYQIAKYFNPKPFFWLISSFIGALSPPLIFLSKTPNETIVLTFILTLIFYLLITNKRLRLTIIAVIAALFVSKFAWFILPPFLFFTVYSFNKKLNRKGKLLVGLSTIITIVVIGGFLTVPQASRSLSENNFSIFSDITVKNGLEKLRGQGAESGWPKFVDRILFNKSEYLQVGFLHWLSHFNPAIFFGDFDDSGEMSFSFIGVFAKVLLIPAIFGIFFIIRKGGSRTKLLLFIFLSLTFPGLFIYPSLSLELNVLIIPFVAILIAFGFIGFNKRVTGIILFLMLFETIINIFNFSSEFKNTNTMRPIWIKKIVVEAFNSSKQNFVAISDDLVSDVVPFIEWYTDIDSKNNFSHIKWPYKFRQYNIGNIKVIGSGDNFHSCGKDDKEMVFISKRDLSKIQHEFEVKIAKIYPDSTGEDKAYLLSNSICIN